MILAFEFGVPADAQIHDLDVSSDPDRPDPVVRHGGDQAGQRGAVVDPSAYTFMAPDEIAMVRTIERVIGQPIPRISVPGYDFGTVAAD